MMFDDDDPVVAEVEAFWRWAQPALARIRQERQERQERQQRAQPTTQTQTQTPQTRVTDPTDAGLPTTPAARRYPADQLTYLQMQRGLCSHGDCQWPINAWCGGCGVKLCYDHLQDHACYSTRSGE